MIPLQPKIPINYTLTDTTTIACHGTSFPTIEAAKNYAFSLRQLWGLCETFSIGAYSYEGHKEVYNSNKPY